MHGHHNLKLLVLWIVSRKAHKEIEPQRTRRTQTEGLQREAPMWRLDAELLKVMIEVFVNEQPPIFTTHFTEERM